jgi:hypothetical protein
MPETETLWKRVGLHSAIFRNAALQPLGLTLTLRGKWLWSAKDRLKRKNTKAYKESITGAIARRSKLPLG